MMTRQEAEQYIEKNRVDKTEKPLFHLTTPVGWMNDPNGFSVYENKVHLFYQFHPYSSVWGPMHWGHSQSEDFLKWEELPTALAPDSIFDEAGCFSGTAIEEEGKHVLFYTGVMEQKNPDGTKKVVQNQCMAVGNGRNYEKVSTNPIVEGKIMPEECSRADFRDPKVWKGKDGLFYMLVGNKTYNEEAQVVLFQSRDMYQWEFVSVFAKDTEKKYGAVWECPDYFKMNEADILIVSPQDMQADEEFHNGNNVVCFIGKVDDTQMKFHYNKAISLDYGFDFYAAQTVETIDGRRILIGWLQSWDSTNNIPKGQKWAGMMSVPRELQYRNNKLLQNPVRELEKYHKNKKEIILNEKNSYKAEISGRIMDMTVEISKGIYDSLSIIVAKNERYETRFCYHPNKRVLVCDRTNAGWIRDINCIRKINVKNADGVRKLRFVMDKNSIELFINDGEQVFSTVIYTPEDATEIAFECVGQVTLNVIKYDLCFE